MNKTSIINIVNAVKTIQCFYRANSHPPQPPKSDSARKQLIKKFITNYQIQQREPIVNANPEVRNKFFKQFCATIIQKAARKHHKILMNNLKQFEIYKIAAKIIFKFYQKSNLKQNEFFKQRKIVKIQKQVRKWFNNKKFQILKSQIQKLSDPETTNPLQLLKLLDPAQAELICSFGEQFCIKFRLCDEDAAQAAQTMANPQPTHQLSSNNTQSNPIQSQKNQTYQQTQQTKPQKFDPKIYYKVFLKQKVVDIAETAPRNYALENQTQVVDRRLWYVRFTNSPYKRLNGSVLQYNQFQIKPFVSRQEVFELKQLKQVKWQNRMREQWLGEKFGVGGEGKEEGEVLEWAKKLDYFEYETYWKLSGTLQGGKGVEFE